MKKKIYILGILSTIIVDKVYAFETTKSFVDTLTLGFFILMIIGVIIIVISKIKSNKEMSDLDKKNNKKNILDDKNPKKKSIISPKLNAEEQEIIEENEFDEFSIYKSLPSFSNKEIKNTNEIFIKINELNEKENLEGIKEYINEEIYNDLENKENEKRNDIKLFKVEENKIVDFKDNDTNYELKSRILISYKVNNEYQKIIYRIISTLEKNNKLAIDRCPSCGGKLENNEDLRCPHCNGIIPTPKKTENSNKWIIKEYTKKETTL